MAGAQTKDELLQQAVEATQSGEPKRAREFLLELLNMDNREPLYWLLMSTAVESREERIYCLQNVLFLDPENSAARHDLELLGADVPELNAPALIPEETTNWQTTEIAAPKIPKRRRKVREEPWSLTWILGSLGLGAVVIVLGLYAAENGFLDAILQTTPAATSGPGTPLATRTPSGEATSTRQIALVPSDPQDLLEATYTPTPVYINTPHPETPNFEQGLAALAAEDWNTAIDAFQAALTANPQAADAAYYLGVAHIGADDLVSAQAAFNRAISLEPQFAPGYLGRAQVGMALGADASAIITDLNTATLLDPNFIDAYLGRAAFNMQRGNYEDAEEDIAAAEELDPRSALVQYNKAVVALAEQQYSIALEAATAALDLDVTLLPAYPAKAEAEQGMALYQESVATMQTYLTFNGGDARGWELLGLGFNANGDEELAMEAFDQALSIDPNLPYASYYRGLVELDVENYLAAQGYMQVAVAGAPGFFEAHIGMARAMLGLGNPSGAFFEINQASPLLENDEQRAAFFYWRALALEGLGQPENALADWRSLLALPAESMPDDWRATAEERLGL